MSRPVSIIEEANDKASVGRSILGMTAGAVIGGGMLIAVVRGGLPVPAVPLPDIARPQAAADGGGRQVIAVGEGTRRNRCDVSGVVNGVSQVLEVDTGDPGVIDLPGKFVERLGLKPGPFIEHWQGTRYGSTTTATVREIRTGNVVWENQEARVYSNWAYSFGPDEIPLFGLAGLKMRGVNVEFDGPERCRLTVARNRRAG